MLEMKNLKRAMPALEKADAAFEVYLRDPAPPSLVILEGLVGEYNKAAIAAAEAIYEDTKDRNCKDTIMLVFARKDAQGVCPPIQEFKGFLENACGR